MHYQPRLDSIRFFAVLLVIFSHWLPTNIVVKMIPNIGNIGVSIFFVLSGYLITANLVKLRKYSLKKAFTIFYINRVLRIFPIYYLLLLTFLILNISFFDSSYKYYLMYLTNFLVFRTGNWPGMFSHLWSLAVEEQFYLFWPILVLFFKEKKLDLIILFTFVISIILKLTSFFFVKNQFIDLLPFSQFDLFMFGAYLTVKKDYLVSRTQEFSQYKLTLSLVFTSILVVITGDNYLIKNISVGFFSTFLILVINFNRTIFKLFDFKPFIFLGRISYGLYLYHNFIPLFARNLVGTEKKYILFQKVLPNYNSVVYNLSIEFILLIVLSTLSWYLIEKRFLKLKITDY